MSSASANGLIGVGVSAQVAAVIGQDYSALTCAGSSSQTNAAKILSKMVELTSAAGANSAVLPANANLQEEYNVIVTAGSTASAIIYVPSGHTLVNSTSTLNGGVTVAAGKTATLWQYKANTWAVSVSA